MLAVPTVTIIDDDDSVRRALTRLLNASGYGVRTYASATEFLDDADSVVPGPGCLLLDVRLPGLGGLELLTALKKSGTERAVVFMTGHGDVLTGVKAMKGGAVDFLLKPFSDEELLDAIGRAVIRDGNVRATQIEVRELNHRAARLTRREREVCFLVVSGRLNKQIAAALGTTEKTVKVHRSRVMAKMQAHSLAELVRFVEFLKRAPRGESARPVAPPPPPPPVEPVHTQI
jgi:FixJ family two-component response regulator